MHMLSLKGSPPETKDYTSPVIPVADRKESFEMMEMFMQMLREEWTFEYEHWEAFLDLENNFFRRIMLKHAPGHK
jgi:hypothetical protein